jgi:hypothetical protein
MTEFVPPVDGGAVCPSCGAEYPRDFVGDGCLFCESSLTRDSDALVEGRSHLKHDLGGLADNDDDILTLIPVDYLGGYPGLPNPLRRLHVYVSASEFSLYGKQGELLTLDMGDVIAIEAEGSTEVQKRVTVTRLLALGLFALAVPKARKLAYLVVTTRDGEMIVSTTKHTSLELHALLNRYVGAHEPEVSTRGSVADAPAGLVDELERVARLHERGLLTAEEFAEAKRLLFDQNRSE